MIEKLRELGRSSLIYGAGNYGVKLVGFFLIPVYTRYLAPADYGVLALVATFNRVLFIFLNMGQTQAMTRFYFDTEETEERARVIAASMWIVLIYSLPMALLLLSLSGTITNVLLKDSALQPLVMIGILTMGCRVILRLPFGIMRAEKRDKEYASWSLVRTALSAGLAIFFVVGLNWGVRGVLMSALVAEVGVMFFLVPVLFRSLRVGWTPKQSWAQLSFGLAFVPAGLSAFTMDLADRGFLQYYASIEEVGLYSLGYRFGEIIFFMVTAVQLAWPQFVFSNRKDENAPRLYAYASTYYIAGMCFLVLAISLMAPEVITIMATPAFHRAAVVVPLIAASGLCEGICSIGMIGIMFRKKPIVRTMCLAVAAVVNIGLNFLLIPRFGMLGAAWATLIAFIVHAVLLVWRALLFYYIPYQYGRMAKLIAGAAALFAAGQFLPAASPLLTLGMKLLLLGAFPGMLWLLGFFEAAELVHVQGLRNSIARRFRPARSRT